MNIQILKCAEIEIAEAMDYYNNQYSGLGYEFAFEVKESINRILSFPNAWPIFVEKTHKCNISRFPYGILYEQRKNIIIVFAVMNLKQDPEKWESYLINMGKSMENEFLND